MSDAKAGKDGGFKSATFVEAGKRLRELAALEPFQPGYLTTTHAESTGIFGDGKAAMELMGEWLIGMQAPTSASGKGQPEEDIGIFSFPVVAGGKGKATDTLGGVNGFLVTKTAPKEAVDFLNFFSQEKYAKEAAEKAPTFPSTRAATPGSRIRWSSRSPPNSPPRPITRTSSIRISALRSVASSTTSRSRSRPGQMTPEAAAAAIQDAGDQQ